MNRGLLGAIQTGYKFHHDIVITHDIVFNQKFG